MRALPAVRTALPPVEVASSCLLATRSRCQRAGVWNISGCETRVSLSLKQHVRLRRGRGDRH